MNETPPDDRFPLAIAYQWVGRILAVSAAMVLPGLVGIWVDEKLTTKIVFTLLGFTIGLVACVWYLIRITAPKK